MADSDPTVERLRAFITERRAPAEFTFDRLYGAVDGVDQLDALSAIARLVNEGVVEQFVRVISEGTHGGIGDYPSYLDVPPMIHDWRRDVEIETNPSNLRVMYRLPRR